ncbi:MAG TPA: hypothetical protein VKQ72_01145 [Aggregatilineales bacterium]|nr:hypothetical protein [Aggregatilineales bacterium]
MAKKKALAEQLKNEPMQDYIKFLVFAEMGSGRSLSKAFRQYYESKDDPSKMWIGLSEQYRWGERAAKYDETNA